MLKFTVFFCLVAFATSADNQQCQIMAAPGTTITTTTTSTTTYSRAGSSGVGSALFNISPSDLEIIRSTWEKAKKDGDVAPQVLYQFLKAHPEYQKKFTSFANVPQSELLKDGHFLSQAYTIMAGLNVVIESVGSSDLVAVEVSHLGVSHFERGVTIPMFEQFARIIVDVLQQELHFDDSAKHAWENGLSALIAGISKSLKKKEDVPHPLTKLTPHQISDIRRNWQSIRSDRYSIISQIFLKLFKERSGLQQKFSTFGSVPLNDLPSNAAFNAQVKVVADRMDEQIEVMDEPLKWMGQIRYMAFSHKPRGVLRQEFSDFGRYFFDVMRSKGISESDMESWKGAFTVYVDSVAKIQGL